jgi:hypothetical protein
MYRIFIGWDPNEVEAYHVLCHSLIRHASAPISITPLKLEHLPMWRERHPQQSTEFSFSRFLVPHLCNYEGQALFIDCDMMVTRDVVELFKLNSEKYAVSVVKHDYEPKDDIKFLNQQQSVYPRKNWSSVMLFNNGQCRELTPKAVNTWSGLDLHRFTWLHDSQIGELPAQWGHLVGEYEDPPTVPANLHWTIGGPWFDSYRNTNYAQLWREERKLAHGR